LILKPSLDTLDSLNVDAIAIALSADLSQMSGALGFLDWRLCGMLSDLILSEQIKGEPGELVLLSTYGRIKAPRLFVFGWGRQINFEVTCNTQVLWMLDVLKKAHINTCAMAMPESSVLAHKIANGILQKENLVDQITLFDARNNLKEAI